MNCEEARQSLDAYVDGELEPAHQLEIESALGGMRFVSRRGRTDHQN